MKKGALRKGETSGLSIYRQKIELDRRQKKETPREEPF